MFVFVNKLIVNIWYYYRFYCLTLTQIQLNSIVNYYQTIIFYLILWFYQFFTVMDWLLLHWLLCCCVNLENIKPQKILILLSTVLSTVSIMHITIPNLRYFILIHHIIGLEWKKLWLCRDYCYISYCYTVENCSYCCYCCWYCSMNIVVLHSVNSSLFINAF